MRRIEGSMGVKMLECVNPKKDKWRIRWDVTETDGGGASYMEEEFDHKPTEGEVKAIVTAWHNARTQETILKGMEYEGAAVWLSLENQMNYKAAYDLAVQTNGATLPVTFKLGTDEEPVYRTFETLEEIRVFYLAVARHLQEALYEGWKRKDSIDMAAYSLG